MELEVTAAIETYSSECNENLYNNDFSDFSVPSSRQRGQGQQYDNTPTNAEMSLLKKACDGDSSDLSSDLESLCPSVPLRTSSILPSPAMVPKGETFRSYINLKDLEPPQA